MRTSIQIILIILSFYTILSCGRDTQMLPSNLKEEENPLTDTDKDGLVDSEDNCPAIANQDQKDSDANAIGDLCEKPLEEKPNDKDGDTIDDSKDNCVDKANTDQKDSDADGKGDECDESTKVEIQEKKDGDPQPSQADQKKDDTKTTTTTATQTQAPAVPKFSTALVKSPQGLTVIGLDKDNKAYHIAVLASGSKATDNYNFTDKDEIVKIGRFLDVNGDSILVRNVNNSIYYLLQLINNKWVGYSLSISESDKGVLQLLGLTNPYFYQTKITKGDFDGDKKDELIFIYNNILVIFKIDNNQLKIKKSYKSEVVNNEPNVWFGAWNFYNNQTIESVGDYDGDGKDDFIIKSGWGMGIIKMNKADYSLTSIAILTNNVQILYNNTYSWTFLSQKLSDFDPDAILSLGNFIDGIAYEFILQEAGNIAYKNFSLFNVNNNKVESIFDNKTNGQVLNTGDYNGDGKMDVLYKDTANTTKHKLSILSSDANFTVTKWEHGSKTDGWFLNFSDNVFPFSGDFTGDTKDEFIIKSPWGFGIMGVKDNKFTAIYAQPYQTAIKGLDSDNTELTLTEKDTFLGVGKFIAE